MQNTVTICNFASNSKGKSRWQNYYSILLQKIYMWSKWLLILRREKIIIFESQYNTKKVDFFSTRSLCSSWCVSWKVSIYYFCLVEKQDISYVYIHCVLCVMDMKNFFFFVGNKKDDMLIYFFFGSKYIEFSLSRWDKKYKSSPIWYWYIIYLKAWNFFLIKCNKWKIRQPMFSYKNSNIRFEKIGCNQK